MVPFSVAMVPVLALFLLAGFVIGIGGSLISISRFLKV